MKILLIQPSQLDMAGKPLKYKKLWFPSLALPTIAALTPKDIDVKIINDLIEEINYNEEVDLVGITALTSQAPRAYQISENFRKKGIKTILGGIHATQVPDEALKYCDSVLIGEAENIWQEVLEDFKRGKLRRIYKSNNETNLDRLIIPRFDLINRKHYFRMPFSKKFDGITIQTSRGCPFKCDFCSVPVFLGNKIRKKPIENVIAEIKAVRAEYYYFTDDNIIGDMEYAKELFNALIPLKIKWYGQISTNIINNLELITLAGKSGCLGVLIGIESDNLINLVSVNKHQNNPILYKNLFKILKENEILADVSLLYGFDHDSQENFLKMVDELLKMDIHYLFIFYLSPMPNTNLFKRLKSSNRISITDWSYYDGLHKVIEFNNFNNIDYDYDYAYWLSFKRFYSIKNIIKRIWRFKKQYFKINSRNSFILDFIINFFIRYLVHRKKTIMHLGIKL